MFDRRSLLLSAAALLAGPAGPAGAAPPGGARGSGPGPAAVADPRLAAALDAMVSENLEARPESATQLGLDVGARSGLRARLTDESPEGRAARRALTRAQTERLEAFQPAALGPDDRLNVEVLLYGLRSAARVQAFDFGGASYGASPYVVSQLTGSYQSTPDFLDTKHPIKTAADAEAYLLRLEAFAGQLDANTEQMERDAGKGVLPPDFLMDVTLSQLEKTEVPPGEAVVVTSLVRRGAAAGLDPAYGRRAETLYRDKVSPALGRQIEAARRLRARARSDAGLWALPEGEAFYAAALHSATTTALTADEIHKIGLDQANEIRSRLDGLLRAAGFTQGTVGQRMAALYKDPRQLYPNTDAGKAEAIAYCNGRLDAIRPRLPSQFRRLPPFRFEVRRVPAATEPGAASAFSQGPALDGTRPGLVYFNLHDSAEWPKFCLATTVFHEGLPGHQLEGGLALSNPHLPLIRKMSGYSGYAEGWALYAEQLADEMGMYADDPLGRLGYLKFQLFRANRCVVDTGIHHKRWTRDQAVAYFVDQEGEAPGFASREVDRYCATPGQACSYKLGHTVFVTLRSKAQAALGAAYDPKDFHEAVLNCGRVPLEVLEEVGARYIAQARA